ncbi:hypothetical protein [Actinoplanes xinjiangensis]|uniref:hypothetical protein n=1 Tax=Actinoplanes xinjiangensis TaxID=512350 RepID=UPI00130E8F59|nr:hypothetical protein [Actinoplanes xinjiangensis]
MVVFAAGADAGAFASLGGDDIGVAVVGVAPAQVRVQGAGQGDVVGVVRAGKGDDCDKDEAFTDALVPGALIKDLELHRKTGAVKEVKLA